MKTSVRNAVAALVVLSMSLPFASCTKKTPAGESGSEEASRSGEKIASESPWYSNEVTEVIPAINKPQVVGEKILTGLGVMPLLCDNIGGGHFPLKPAPDAFLYLLEKYNIAKENALIAGDNHTDINAASAAGVSSIFCEYGFGFLDNAVPTFSVKTFAELVNVALG